MSSITKGWLARHVPQGPQGRYAALIDIAQDLLLAHLYEQGMFDHLMFKGGTALRKLYAGNAGRFSTDLDFSVRDPADDSAAVSDLLRDQIDGLEVDGFRFAVRDHRGRPQVSYETPFGGVGRLTTKLDLGPAPWLPPDQRGWVHLAIHNAYDLPTALPVMALVENLAEKIARLTRRTPARDVYDLVWVATNSPHSSFDRAAVRRLAVLKTGSTSTDCHRRRRLGLQSRERLPTTPRCGVGPARQPTSMNKTLGCCPYQHRAWTSSANSSAASMAFSPSPMTSSPRSSPAVRPAVQQFSKRSENSTALATPDAA